MKESERFLDVNTVARRLNISPGTVRSLLRDPASPLRGTRIGRSIRVYADSIDKLLLEGEKNLIEL